MFIVVCCSAVLLVGCGGTTPLATAEEDATATPEPEITPTLKPLAGDDPVTDPTGQMDEYLGEGLFISHFDSDDFDSWIDYSQDTETSVTSGEPPEGYINVSGWHPGYDDKWVQPTEGFQMTDATRIAGYGAGHWMDTVSSSRVVIADIPHDWSGHMFLSFWVYSAEATNAGL